MCRSGDPIILVIEDYADSRVMLTALLESLNYRVLAAADGKQALKLAANHHIDLVVTDFGLPDMDGVTVVRELRQLNDHLRRVPIIMLTAFQREEFHSIALEAGCTEFVTKPADFDTLQAMITRLLSDGCETDEDTHAASLPTLES